MAMLEVNGVTKKFGGIVALKDVDLQVEKGSVVAIIGPNGSGKTTMLNVITGVYIPEEGQILLDGQRIQGMSSEKVCHAGVSRTFQNIRLFTNLSAIENVMLGSHRLYQSNILNIVGKTKRFKAEEKALHDKAEELLRFVGLDGKADFRMSKLTYAQQRYLEIARALASDPKLLLLDEPAAGMNAAEIANLIVLIRRMSEKGITILLIEHIMDLIKDVADKVYVLNYGEKIAEGTYDNVSRNPLVIEAYLGKGAIKKC